MRRLCSAPPARNQGHGPPRHRWAAARHGDWVKLGVSLGLCADVAVIKRAELPLDRRTTAQRWHGVMQTGKALQPEAQP